MAEEKTWAEKLSDPYDNDPNGSVTGSDTIRVLTKKHIYHVTFTPRGTFFDNTNMTGGTNDLIGCLMAIGFMAAYALYYYALVLLKAPVKVRVTRIRRDWTGGRTVLFKQNLARGVDPEELMTELAARIRAGEFDDVPDGRRKKKPKGE